jgi:hypothetical protein
MQKNTSYWRGFSRCPLIALKMIFRDDTRSPKRIHFLCKVLSKSAINGFQDRCNKPLYHPSFLLCSRLIGACQNCEAKNITENLSPVLTRSLPLVSPLTGLPSAVLPAHPIRRVQDRCNKPLYHPSFLLDSPLIGASHNCEAKNITENFSPVLTRPLCQDLSRGPCPSDCFAGFSVHPCTRFSLVSPFTGLPTAVLLGLPVALVDSLAPN